MRNTISMSGFARPQRQRKRVGKFGTAQREMVEIATDRVDWRDEFRIAFDGVLRGEVAGTSRIAATSSTGCIYQVGDAPGPVASLRAGYVGYISANRLSVTPRRCSVF